jgi:acyl-CoA thioesterase-1
MSQGCTIYRVAALSFNPARILPLLPLLPVLVAMGLVAATAWARSPTVILVLGDSLIAGYGLAPEESFPSQLEAALERNGTVARVVNGGVSGDTSAGGLARLDWLLADKPDLVIVELGANDGLRGLDPEATRRNLDEIIKRIRASGIDVLLAGMRAPPNLGTEYGTAFSKLYGELATQYGLAYYPFFLEGVAADPALNQEDGIHPTAEGVAVIVKNILPVVVGALVESRR